MSLTPAINCSAVSTTPAKNLSPVSLTLAINLCHGEITKKPKIFRRCQRIAAPAQQRDKTEDK